MPHATRTVNLARQVRETLTALVGIAAVSGQEDDIHRYLQVRLEAQGVACAVDVAGNLIAQIPGRGRPLLLNAHMDRVPPGRGHSPVVVEGRMRSDGATNLGADDAAGLTIVLLTIEELLRRDAQHAPVVALFTVGEEVGLTGASAFDPTPWQVEEGIVFDNAGAAGEVVMRAASYVAFDVTLHGRGGHPGKSLAGTASAVEIFRRVTLPLGSLDGDTTRISIGRIEGGAARNAIPTEINVAGEVRTLLAGESLRRLLASIQRDFADAAHALGGSAECVFTPHGAGYTLDDAEPLLRDWRAVWEARGQRYAPLTTFISSDANALRSQVRVFTVSTGVEDEHTSAESIALAPLAELVEAAVALLSTYRSPAQEEE